MDANVCQTSVEPWAIASYKKMANVIGVRLPSSPPDMF